MPLRRRGPVDWFRHRRLVAGFGGATGTRTPDPLHAMQVLFQLSYSPTGWGVYQRTAGAPPAPPGRGTIGPMTATDATETPAVARLPGGALAYTLRRSPRSHGLRVVIHPDRGVVVTVPAAGRRGWADPERHITPFLAEREPWLRRHLERMARDRAILAARGGLRDGATIRFRGDLHRLRLVPARRGPAALVRRTHRRRRRGRIDRPPRAARIGVRSRPSSRRGSGRAPGPPSTQEIRRHATALGVTPAAVTVRDQRTRWGSASRAGRLAFSWRLILAPPEALETVVIHELAHLRVFGHGPKFWDVVASRRPDHKKWRRWLHDHAAELHGALADDV